MSRVIAIVVYSGLIYGCGYMSGRCKEKMHQFAKR